MKHYSKKLWGFVLLSVSLAGTFSSEEAFAVTGGFAPGFDANGVTGTSLVGSNYFLGSIVGRGRFHVSPNNPDTVDPSTGRSNDHRELSEDSANSLFTDMTWMIGYNYYNSSGVNTVTGETATDDSQSLRLGFALDLNDSFDIIGSATYQVIPEENFSQGLFDLDAGYYISLKKSHLEKVKGDDAESFYLRKAKQQEEVIYPPKDQFPNLKVGFHFMFAQDRKSPTTERVEGSGLTSDVLLNLAGSGPYLNFALNRLLSFKLALLIYYYDVNVHDFLSNTTIGSYRPQAGLAIADLDDTTPILLTYPYRSVTASMNFQTGIKTSLQVALQHATYFGSIGGSDTTSLGAILSQTISAKVKLGVQIDLTGGGGGFNGGSPTGTTGGVTLGYLF